ncbi:TonB-dependent receptor domain-containing protein [Sphingomonas sp. 28-62-11]|uniref:TonB-dependent receptor domain-containing protein n=1 Tax=Sphingomonas sp. 28-62-11 TaxID=1970432 RepID=UPI000BCB2B9C|nr:MAG: TonB-dependent receptor [Sphingomonas sp. 28-62-11]
MHLSSKLFALSSASVVALMLGGAAHAQTAPDAEPAANDDTIVVTGSRLQRDPNATAPLPVSSVTAEQLRAAGNTDVTATLRTIPALISSGSVADSLERGGGGVGQATLNLRQLGSNRTLVLIDGYRHVSGVAGAQTVDVATIPNALIERVDVLTGGASAVYGADAVTGVVNYVLNKNFEGLRIDAQGGISSQGDGETFRIEGTYGKNFAGGRGNFSFTAGYTNDAEVLLGDRDFTADNGRGNNSTTYANPARRFQKGDINAATMPNFANFFRVGGPGPRTSRISFGPAIPTAAQFATMFPGRTPTAAEQALIDRATNSPTFVIARQPVFAISSNAGLIFRADFARFSTDLNNNGIADCNESFVGWTGFGGGGCYVSTSNGGVKIFEDGIISTSQNQFGGDGAVERTNQTSLIPGSERFYGDFRANFELSPAAEFFVDAKYARNNTTSRNNYNTFYDSLLIFPDNPFTPAALQAESNAAGGLRVSRDFLDLGPNIQTAKRDTYRIVGGVRGEVTSNLNYELVANYGRTDNSVTQSNSVLYDRLFAAIDVVRGPNGQPICRSNISNVPHPGSETFPFIEGGFFTFRPGDGQCRPANILNGVNSISQDAVDFITTPTTDLFRLTQFVINGTVTGDTGGFFTLPGGAVQFAIGGEYRRETSSSRFSDLELGILPANSPAGPAGTFIGDVSANQQLIFDPSTRTLNTGGSFDVKEVFGEFSLPLLKDTAFFHELTVGAAGRYADYSTVGGAFTWNVNGIWAPIPDIRFRGTYARAIRAPNIAELFSPAQGATFRPSDPCDVINQNATAARRANCIAAATALGIPNAATFIANYSDPLTGRFSGTSGGNPNLNKETATTFTVGAVVQPRFIRGLTVSADYYSIRINDAIAAVQAQDIVNTCYDNTTFPNQFCSLFRRNGPTAGPATFGFNFLTQTQLNFGRIETSGIDASINYGFDISQYKINVGVNGNWTEKVDRFFDPNDPTLVNPALRELSVPEFSGTANINVKRGRFTVGYNVQYIDSTAVAAAVQIERIATEFGDAGFAPTYFVHGLSFNFDIFKDSAIYGGVNNLTDAQPYLSSSAYPVSGLGRLFFLGIRTKL